MLSSYGQPDAPTRQPAKVIQSTATPTQIAVITHPARFKSVVATRKWGKSTCGKLKVMGRVGRPKRGGLFQWIAPTYRQCQDPYRSLYHAFSAAGQLVGHNAQAMTLDLATGWRVDFRSAEAIENLRGDGPDEIIVDEVAQIADEAWEEVIRPSIAVTQADVLFLGTPKGRRGIGYKMWARGQADPETGRPLDPLYKSWRFTCYDAVFIPRSEIEEAQRTLSDRAFRQEFMAEFLDTSGVVFENVRSRRAEPLSEEPVGIGADWAKDVDYTWFVAVGAESGSIRKAQRLPKKLSYIEQTRAFKQFCAEFQDRGFFACHDKTGVGNAVDDLLLLQQDEFFDEGNLESFVFTHKTKCELVEAGVVNFESGQLGFPKRAMDDADPLYETLVRELEEFSLEVGKTGKITYGAPPGLHDDGVMAVLLANRARSRVAHREYGGVARITFM